MAKQFFQKISQRYHHLRHHRLLGLFGRLIDEPNLWYLNRYSVANAVAIGLFCAYMPMPFQMLLAACLALVFRAHIILSIALVWISNPITMPAMFYFSYKLGAWMLGLQSKALHFTFSWEWFLDRFQQIWQPLLLGSFFCAAVSALLGSLLVRFTWRLAAGRKWRQRQTRKLSQP